MVVHSLEALLDQSHRDRDGRFLMAFGWVIGHAFWLLHDQLFSEQLRPNQKKSFEVFASETKFHVAFLEVFGVISTIDVAFL